MVDRSKRQCTWCLQYGHLADSCPNRRRETVSQQYVREQVAKDMKAFYDAFPLTTEKEKKKRK